MRSPSKPKGMSSTHRVQLPFEHDECDKANKDCNGEESDVGQHLSRQITCAQQEQSVCEDIKQEESGSDTSRWIQTPNPI